MSGDYQSMFGIDSKIQNKTLPKLNEPEENDESSIIIEKEKPLITRKKRIRVKVKKESKY